MLELARATGIQVPFIRLVPVAEIEGLPQDAARLQGNALAFERFDRAAGGRRIHMEDFAQVFGLFPHDKYGERSYANIAAVLWAETGEEGTYEFVRRLVFSVLIGNADILKTIDGQIASAIATTKTRMICRRPMVNGN